MVNVTLVDFRGFDTLGEITVLAVAALGVVNLIGVARREQRRKRQADGVDEPDGAETVSARRSADRARSVILTTTARGLAPTLAVVAVYVAFRGHNAPGGGFAGGLILSSAVILGYLADGRTSLDARRLQPLVLVGVGLAVAVSVAVTPLLFGDALLESAIWKLHVPAIGTLKLVSSSLFDVGVMILVTGVVLAALGGVRPGPRRRRSRRHGGHRMSVVLAVLIGTLAAVGTSLILQRSLTRIVLGLGLLANAANLLVLAAGGPPAGAPIVGRDGPLGDPVPQALVLTSIVIGFAITTFLLAVAYRSWTIDGNDEVEDDLEDRRLAAAERSRTAGEKR